MRSIFDTLFIKNFRAAEPNSPIEYRVSKLLVDDTRKLSKRLEKILFTYNYSDVGLDKINLMITKAFKASEGNVEIKIKESVINYEGNIGYVDVSGGISLVSYEADIELLYEDLLQAFYKSRGGKFGLSKDFMDFILKDKHETQYSKFIEV